MEALFPGLVTATDWHPLFVHFPIAFWSGAFLFALLGAVRASDRLVETGRWLLYLGVAGAIPAAATGWWAMTRVGEDPIHDRVHVHQYFMLAATGLAIAAAITGFALRRRADARARWVLAAMLGATVAVTTLGADRGAELVYRYGVGTRPEMPTTRSPPAHGDHDH